MTKKKIAIKAKPKPSVSKKPSVQDWVNDNPEKEKNKRLTIDIPESLHRSIKTSCATSGTKMADEIRTMLLNKWG